MRGKEEAERRIIMKEKPVLTNKEEYPDEVVLERALKQSFAVYQKLTEAITGSPYDITQEWRFYKDGNSWLSKNTFKKKTVFWLSVWEGYFKVSFYFSAKNYEGVLDLDIDEKIKAEFKEREFIGKLKPLSLVVEEESLQDTLKLISYKKKCG
jgi:hypothetical protein